ncbi:(+)-neomenthol dehydrogenase [Lactuca sativa]|uniref:Glucose/ribitol dehydrogenase n=1 Tax=Lactuca sativa TaxID=4236 RepID=A0A9R1W7H9_LACSA|nr:(+)-neomenthol dehydrogenase [Lactuca sativa]KAJ0217500.1 hypothetical protein LSAT_V11C300104160 [Lactuca sativa]
MEDKRCALVTGGNKGIGFEICRQLASNGIKVVLTDRDESLGAKVVQQLNVSGFPDVVFHQLDIRDPVSISRTVDFVKAHFKKLDILVNNAGHMGIIILNEEKFRAGEGFVQVLDEKAHLLTDILKQTYELAEECIKTNYYGTKAVTKAFLPLLQLSNSPRIVNITSSYGELFFIHNEKVRNELRDMKNVTEERVDEITGWFLRDLKAGKLEENGWPLTVSAYKVSKAAINAYTRLMAKDYPKMLINCVHPGYVITDMSAQTGYITPEEGAKAPVMVALLPNDGPSGKYFSQLEISQV